MSTAKSKAKKRNPEDEPILSYQGGVLVRSDLSILRSPVAFLNDRLLSFFFAHISSSLTLDVLLVDPPISYWIVNAPDEESIRSASDPLLLPSPPALALFPLNDNPDPTAPNSGSHWSLLVFLRCPSGTVAVHHDSWRGLNWHVASRLFDRLRPYYGEGDVKLIEGSTPQQANGHDCGLFVMAVAQAVCDWYREGRKGENWLEKVEKLDVRRVASMREELLTLILELMEQQEN